MILREKLVWPSSFMHVQNLSLTEVSILHPEQKV